jgi:GTP-binding protein HflX
VSSLTGKGLEEFLRVLAGRLRAVTTVVELLIPYDRGDVLASVHREGEVISSKHVDGGIAVRARLSDASRGRLQEFTAVGASDTSNTGDRQEARP